MTEPIDNSEHWADLLFNDEDDRNIDLGSGVRMRYWEWHGHPDERGGAFIAHRHPDGKPCVGSITFDVPVSNGKNEPHPRWRVQSWEPLTLSPSIHMDPAKGGCGLHGFIREGRWIGA